MLKKEKTENHIEKRDAWIYQKKHTMIDTKTPNRLKQNTVSFANNDKNSMSSVMAVETVAKAFKNVAPLKTKNKSVK